MDVVMVWHGIGYGVDVGMVQFGGKDGVEWKCG